jgi:hypothetical protein
MGATFGAGILTKRAIIPAAVALPSHIRVPNESSEKSGSRVGQISARNMTMGDQDVDTTKSTAFR